jgi:hypothetical protein
MYKPNAGNYEGKARGIKSAYKAETQGNNEAACACGMPNVVRFVNGCHVIVSSRK